MLMLTVSKLAKYCGLSRTAILYYESVGLIKPCLRSQAGYRLYGEQEVAVLKKIRLYRSVGLSLRDIRMLIDPSTAGGPSILVRRLSEIASEIEALREHQLAILKLLHCKEFSMRTKDMTKEKWISIMKSSGFSEADMQRWHQEFERTAPDDHQEFLTYLHIPADEIHSIRNWSKNSTQA
jgi:DNA-binding transcriptional MerR regulator